jgi:hypothetical protein
LLALVIVFGFNGERATPIGQFLDRDSARLRT